jgi:ecdysone 20-monooxygenase
MILVYLGIALFLYLTFRNKKPIKWSKIFDVISFKSNLNDDIYNIPGPMRLPFLGTTWMKYFNREDKVHEYYEYLNQTYGDIVLESFGNINIVSIFKQQDIEKVLSMKTRYPFRPPVEITCLYRSQRKDRYTSVGLTNSNGPEWNNLRSKMTSRTLENPKVLSQFFPSQIEICNDLIAEIKACRNKNNIVSNVDDILRLFAFESSSSFIVGRRMGSFGSSKSTIGPTAYAIAEASRNIFSVFQKSFYGKD